jgi:hypothetical protein
MTAGDEGTQIILVPGAIAVLTAPVWAGATKIPVQVQTGTFPVGQTITIDPLGAADPVILQSITGSTNFYTTATVATHAVIGTIVSTGYVISTFATCTMLVQYVTTPVPDHIRYPAYINPGGLSAGFTTTGTEFLVGGQYQVALEVVGPGSPPSYRYTSPWYTLRVNSLETP